MAFKAELNVKGKTYALISFSVFVTRQRDEKGRPTSSYHGFINAVIEPLSDTDIVSWMLTNHEANDFTIKIYKSDQQGATLKEISVNGGFCIALMDNFDTESGQNGWLLGFACPHMMTIGGEDIDYNN